MLCCSGGNVCAARAAVSRSMYFGNSRGITSDERLTSVTQKVEHLHLLAPTGRIREGTLWRAEKSVVELDLGRSCWQAGQGWVDSDAAARGAFNDEGVARQPEETGEKGEEAAGI